MVLLGPVLLGEGVWIMYSTIWGLLRLEYDTEVGYPIAWILVLYITKDKAEFQKEKV